MAETGEPILTPDEAQVRLVVAISSRALFDLGESHEVFETEGVDAYCRYQVERENDPLGPGVAFSLVRKLLGLNLLLGDRGRVEVILLSRNSSDTGLRVLNSARHHGLDIGRAVFAGGSSPYRYVAAFGAQLFLSADPQDVRLALDAGCAAATILTAQGVPAGPAESQLRIAFDGDAVLFSDEAERVYRQHGLAAFNATEAAAAHRPLAGGPFKGFLLAVHRIQALFPADTSPLRTALITSRGAPSHERVIRTLRDWGIRIDDALFLGGLDKGRFLRSFGADIFFDDQESHCDSARSVVATGHVPHGVELPKEEKPPAPEPAEGLSALEDEGTTPVRYPSIKPDRALSPSVELTLTVDLLHAPSDDTHGGPLKLGLLPAGWTSLDLSVMLSCPHIDFDGNGRGIVTIRRNQDSVPARIKGRVCADAPENEPLMVSAAFFHDTRFCGSALRLLAMGAFATQPPAERTKARGTVVAEPAARPPDLSVRISRVSGAPGRLDWLVQTRHFDGLPPQLRAKIDLDHEPAAEAAALFAEFATLERGKHRKRIEGFGHLLWQRAPRMFRDVYWALWDHYQRPLTIQFITDEPHLPWELMRPVRNDDSEIHPPLALKHPVARWIERWDGYMRNQLPGGGVFTIAPRYPTASRRLPRAQSEAQALIERFAATRVDGKRLAVEALLETIPPEAPVGVLHFAGHAIFAHTASTQSTIELEDGALAAAEIARPEVGLGKVCRTLVFFNACEVGATGSIFGEVGGWGDAFCSRQFGGFIAPLWSVDDEDASTVAVELLEGIFSRHECIGEVLRAVREKYGDVSPTFYSYLYYGDVTARLVS